MKPRHVDIETLKRLVLYGSPAGRAAALVILDEVTDGKVLQERLAEWWLEIKNRDRGGPHDNSNI